MGQYIWEQRDVMSDSEGSGREMREESGTLGTSGKRSLEQMHLILWGAYNNLADEQQKLLAKCDTAEQQLNQALCLLFNTLQRDVRFNKLQQDLRDDVHAWFERIEEKSRGAEATQGHHDLAEVNHDLAKADEDQGRKRKCSDEASAGDEGEVVTRTTTKKKKSATEFPFISSWGSGDSLAQTDSDAQHPKKSPLYGFSDQAAILLMRLIQVTHQGPSSLPLDKSGMLDESKDHAYATLTMKNWHSSPDANKFTCAVMSHVLTEMKYTAKGSDDNIEEYTKFDESWDTPLNYASLLTEFRTFFGDISVDPVALIKTLHAKPDLETPLVRLLGCFVKQYCSTFFFDNETGKPNGKTSVALAKRVSLPMCRAKNDQDPRRPGCNMLSVRYRCQCCNATCPKRIYMQGGSKVNDEATEAEWATYHKMKGC